jgi:hypothetical protein
MNRTTLALQHPDHLLDAKPLLRQLRQGENLVDVRQRPEACSSMRIFEIERHRRPQISLWDKDTRRDYRRHI